MKSILVPIDFSKASRNAAKYAVSLGASFKATVTFINVVAPPVIIDDSILASVMVTQAELLESNRGLMKKEIDTFSKKYSIKIKGSVEEGYPSDIIGKMAKKNDANLIVMGMKGKGQSNSVFGSTTTTIVRKLSFPVFVIPESASYGSIDKITFATDFDPETKRERYALLTELVKKYNSFIHILNVQKNKMEMNDDEFIGKMRTQFVFFDLKHSFNTIKNKNVIEGINKFLGENPSDILVMMAHKHSLFERMLGKVQTKKMSYETKIPLLILQSK